MALDDFYDMKIRWFEDENEGGKKKSIIDDANHRVLTTNAGVLNIQLRNCLLMTKKTREDDGRCHFEIISCRDIIMQWILWERSLETREIDYGKSNTSSINTI